jgi:HAD superfamily hydrolase (TIGR01549 family)
LQSRRHPPPAAEAFIFDLDGTLTIPQLDFEAIREEMGIAGGPLLEELERLDHEERAARTATLQPGARQVLTELRRRRLPTAILTRNSRQSLDTVLRRHRIEVDKSLSREEAPVKPSPEPVLILCEELGVPPEKTYVTGDYIFDIQSARGAGAVSVLLMNPKNSMFSEQADLKIANLMEILDFPNRSREKTA